MDIDIIDVTAINSIHLANDGGFVHCGSTKSFGAGNFDVLVVKSDKDGTALCSKLEGVFHPNVLIENTPFLKTGTMGTVNQAITTVNAISFEDDKEFCFCSVDPKIKVDADTSNGCGEFTITADVIFNGTSVLWSTGETSQSIKVNEPGDYIATFNYNGCSSIDTVSISKGSGFKLITEVFYNDSCDRFGGSVAFASAIPQSGTPPFKYQWDDLLQQKTPMAIGLSRGTYNVTVTDSTGCESKASVLVENRIQIEITIDDFPCQTCTDGKLTARVTGFGAPPLTYRWNDSDQQTTQTATGLAQGEYVVLITDSNGCFNTDTIVMGTVSVNNVNYLDLGITISPNPSNDYVTIKFNRPIYGDGFIEAKLFSIGGKEVLFKQFNMNSAHNFNEKIGLKNITRGIYIIQLHYLDAMYTAKIIIE